MITLIITRISIIVLCTIKLSHYNRCNKTICLDDKIIMKLNLGVLNFITLKGMSDYLVVNLVCYKSISITSVINILIYTARR